MNGCLVYFPCDKHSNPYHLAGIGLYLADDWINTLDGELETLAALRRTQL